MVKRSVGSVASSYHDPKKKQNSENPDRRWHSGISLGRIQAAPMRYALLYERNSEPAFGRFGIDR